ncbi:Holliday junction resolvase RuvX [Algoriphagus yeomjeoni]|uniref:Holliday junction resolvase RuvX n=1 Tax=Algoriphagus yeomjeoni TaxID=291403 RepID=UPI003CE5BBFA
MPRILAIDLGTKRTGLAVTDTLKMLANPLETIETSTLLDYLKSYCKKEEVDTLVLGYPTRLNGQDNDMTPKVITMKDRLSKAFPDKKIELVDERFTSKMAMQSMITMGSKKKDRKEKAGNLDKVSAAIILQSYLERQ